MSLKCSLAAVLLCSGLLGCGGGGPAAPAPVVTQDPQPNPQDPPLAAQSPAPDPQSPLLGVEEPVPNPQDPAPPGGEGGAPADNP